MPFLFRLVEILTLLLFHWIIAYRLTITLQLAVVWSALLFLIISIIGYGIYARFRWRRIYWRVHPRKFILFILLLAIILGTATLFFNRSSTDDVGIFSQIRLDVLQSDQPFQPRFLLLPRSNQHIEMFRMFSYSAFWGVTGSILSIEPLVLYHNGGSFFGAALWVLVYAALYRELRLRTWEIAGAVLIAILFLLIDGNVGLTHGNWAFFRMWQGKVIGFSVFLPLLLLMAIRFLRHPSWGRWLWMTIVVMVLVDFTRSNIFLVPIFIAAIGLSYLVAYRGRHWRRVLWLGGSAWYPLAFGLFILFTMFLPILAENGGGETLVVETDEPYSVIWWENVYEETIGSPQSLARNVAFLLLPFVLLGAAYRWWIGGTSVFLILLTATPVTGPILIEAVSNSAYWRIIYLLPLPMMAGLVVLVGRYRMVERDEMLRWAVVVLVLGLTVVAFDRAVLRAGGNTTLKSPGEVRLNQELLSFVQETEVYFAGERVIAVNPVANILALTQLEHLEALAYERTPVKLISYFNHLDGVLRCNEDVLDEDEMNAYFDAFQPTVLVMRVMRDCRRGGLADYVARVFPEWEVTYRDGIYAILEQVSANR